MNTFMSGPSQPTQTDKVQRPDAASLQVGVPVSEADLVHLVQEHAAAVEQAAGLAGAAPEAGPGEVAGKRKGLLRRAGRALSKAGRYVGSRALGTAQPPAPTLESVVAVGRNKAAARNLRVMPADDSVSQHTADWQARTQALQKARGDAMAQLGAGLHQARAAQASADVVNLLSWHAQVKQEERLDGLVDHVARDTGLHEEWLGATQRHAQAEWAVAQHMQVLGEAHRAHGRVVAEESLLRRSARLAELRQQACLDALRAPGRGASQAADADMAMPLQDQIAQAKQKLDELEQALQQFEQRRAETQVQANAEWALHKLGTAELAGGRPSEQGLARTVCLRELAAAEERLKSLTELMPPLPSWVDAHVSPELEAVSSSVEQLKRWRDELAEDDLSARARSELRRLAGTAPADPLNRVAQEEPSCRQAWEAAGAHLAQLEVQHLRAHGTSPVEQDPRQHAASSSGTAIAAAAAEARMLSRHAQKWGEELAAIHNGLADVQPDLADAKVALQGHARALESAVDDLPRTHADVAAAEAEWRQHKENLGPVETAVRTAGIAQQAMARVTRGMAVLDGKVEGLRQQVRHIDAAVLAAQGGTMAASIAHPPGISAPGAAADLNDVLTRLRDRLQELPPQGPAVALPRDAMLEMAIRSAARISGSDPAQAGRALSALADLSPEDLLPHPESQGPAAAARAPRRPDAQVIALAQELASLPRGMTLLQGLMAPPQDGLDEERRNGVRVYLLAGRELAQRRDLDATARAWLADAQAGAVALVHGAGGQVDGPRQRAAYQGVSNGFMTDGPGSPYARADEYMRSVTERMLDNAKAAAGGPSPQRHLRRLLAIDKPTPFNRPALAAAGKAAAAVGIVDTLPGALQKMSDAAAELATALGTVPAGPASELLALVAALQERSAAGKPEAAADPVLVWELAGARGGAPAADPRTADAWSGVLDRRDVPTPLEAAQALLARVVAPGGAMVQLRQALEAAKAALIMAEPKARSVDDLVSFFTALLNNFALRDKLKIAGGRMAGATTAGLLATENFVPATGLTGRLDLRRSRQKDEVLELNLGPQAIQMIIGGQTTDVSRVGGGLSAAFSAFGSFMISPLGADWRKTREVQVQDGLSLRVVRTNATQSADLAGFTAAITDMLKWRDATRPDGTSPSGPLEVMLSRHPQVSVNLLGDYERQATRIDASVSAGATVGIPVVKLAANVSAGSRTQRMSTQTNEKTGNFLMEEKKKNVQMVRQKGMAAGVRVPLLADPDDAVNLWANGLRAAKIVDSKTRGVEKIVRLMAKDGALLPHACRYVVEYAGTAAYAKAVRDNRQAWVNHSLKYSFYPEHIPEALRQKDAERELDQFLEELEARSNEFMVGQVVHALSAVATPEVDAQRGLAEVARRAGDLADVARREEALHALLVNPASWEVNRLVVTERSNRTEQPGITMGLVAQSSSAAEASHALLAYPRYPKDLGGLDSMI